MHQLIEELNEAVGELIPPHGPHDGIMTALKSPNGKIVCHAEVVLHDDEDGMECRLFANQHGNEPFDLPISSSLTAVFLQPEQRAATLQVRNPVINEDENGA